MGASRKHFELIVQVTWSKVVPMWLYNSKPAEHLYYLNNIDIGRIGFYTNSCKFSNQVPNQNCNFCITWWKIIQIDSDINSYEVLAMPTM